MAGYNFVEWRYEKDNTRFSERNPETLLVGTTDISIYAQFVKTNP